MFKNITALYVEDEEAIREAISSILPKLFKKFIVAVDGMDGLEKFNEHKREIDVVITDINMPKLNGLDMLKDIKQICPIVPMLITSAHNDLDFLHKAIDVGVTGYVNKPIDIRELLDIIKRNILPIIEKKELEVQLIKQQEKELQNAKFSAIGQLSAGITHEINTPLTYIKGTFEIMQYDIDDLEDSKIKENLKKDSKTIIDGIKRMENIISSMKEMASSSNDEKENVNIYASIVTAIIMTYNKSKHISAIYINKDKFDINKTNENNSFYANVQRQRIEQVWIVIINNAMDELHKRNEFSTNKLEINIYKKDEKIVIEFKDNAGGICDDIINDVFEPFKSTKESSGMGVGLNIAKKIIEENDAIIEAYNENDGAVFKVVL